MPIDHNTRSKADTILSLSDNIDRLNTQIHTLKHEVDVLYKENGENARLFNKLIKENCENAKLIYKIIKTIDESNKKCYSKSHWYSWLARIFKK